MTSHQPDFISRRIGLGLTISGKRMMRMLEPIGRVDAKLKISRRNGGLPSLRNLESGPLRQKAEATSCQKLIHMYEPTTPYLK